MIMIYWQYTKRIYGLIMKYDRSITDHHCC